MRALDAAVTTALAARALVARDLSWWTAKDGVGAPVSVGFWNDLDTRTFSVVDGLTGSTVSRSFYGAGLNEGFDVPLTSDVAVREIGLRLGQVNADVVAAVRGYDIRRAPVQIYRGLFSLTSNTLVAPAVCRFVGFVDGCKITTPKEGAFGSIELTLVSFAREMTRASTETRSDESQKARTANADRFYRYTGVVGEWTIFWGKKRSKANLRQLQHQRRKKG